LTLDDRHEYGGITDDELSPDDPVAARIAGRNGFRKPMSITTDGWSGLAVAAVAATTVHSTAPWYYIFGPVLVIAVGFLLRRSRRGSGGPPGQGPFDGS
jgi:hypothetical protein